MRQVLELALEALESCDSDYNWDGDGDEYQVDVYDRDKVNKAITAIKEALAQPEQEPVAKYCCHLCFNKSGQLFLDRMILCPECGNKRCPKATHHELLCTNSNEPNQTGSVYTTPPQRKPLTENEIKHLWYEACQTNLELTSQLIVHLARNIEAAHGIKE